MPRDASAPVPPPPAPPQKPQERSGAGVAAIIGAAVLLASTTLTAPSEGLRTHPYRDPGNPKLWSVCYGETERAMRDYTAQECLALLGQREANDYAPGVLKCVPGFADPRRRYAFAASIDAAYNGGISGFCRSRMARAFNAQQWRQGCDGFLGWRATANGKVLRGLERRRERERALCLQGIPSAAPAPAAVPIRADYPICVTVNPGPLRPSRRPVLYPHHSELS